MFVLSDKINSTAEQVFEENVLSSHFQNFLFFFSLGLI